MKMTMAGFTELETLLMDRKVRKKIKAFVLSNAASGTATAIINVDPGWIQQTWELLYVFFFNKQHWRKRVRTMHCCNA